MYPARKINRMLAALWFVSVCSGYPLSRHVTGSDDEKLAVFRRVRDDIRIRFRSLYESELRAKTTHNAQRTFWRLIVLKLFERIYAPITAGLLKPVPGDRKLAPEKRCALDRVYQRIVDDLNALLHAAGLKVAA